MVDKTDSTDLSQLKRALTALKEMRARLEAVERARTEPIAIVGMGCRFPGGANNPDLYWQLLFDERDTISEVPTDRWDVDVYYDSDREASGKTYTRHGSFLDQAYEFDPLFFGISPREATTMDPQQRLLLELVWEALENAGISPDDLVGSETGVFAGVSNGDFYRMAYANPDLINSYTGTGSNNGALAGRISYTLGVHGPSFTVDTACSSTLVAVHLACQSLRAGECDTALAGGVSFLLAPGITIGFSKAQMMGVDGYCKAFDANANGYVRGEGGGVFALRRLSDAQADGDRILAVIRGSAVNQDGRSNGLTAPSGLAQEACIRTALKNANVSPGEVEYVEAHGTGTKLGDPIEMQGLGAVFSEGHTHDNPILVGSVKTNVGHLEAGSGAASLAKVVLALQHEEIPAHIHLQELNPLIPWEELPVKVATKRTPWPTGDKPRIAGISGYGFGGTNAHLVVAEAPQIETTAAEVERPSHLLMLSAKSEDALNELAQNFKTHLADHPEQSFADICFTASVGRSHFAHRVAVVAESATQAQEWLTAFTEGKRVPGVVKGRVPGEPPTIAFLFTGQGSQYVGMGRQLYETQPTFRAVLDQCNEILKAYLERPLLSVLYPQQDDEESPINETAYTQPALFALEYSLAQLWLSWGIEPAAVMGHSVGEYVAACIAGVFSLEDGLKLIATRGKLMQSLPQDGAMAAIQVGEKEALAAIAPYGERVSIGAINGPQSTVLSGEIEAVHAVVEQFKAKGVKTKLLNVSHAFHSFLMDPILDQFEAVAREVTFNPPQIPVVSNVTGRMMDYDEVPGPAYWRQHIREGVRFAGGMEALHEQQFDLYLEVGPSPTLLGMGRECIPEESGVWLPSLRKDRDDWQQMLTSLGNLYVNGVAVDGIGFDQDYPRNRLQLPTYPFQRQRYWLGRVEQEIHAMFKSPAGSGGESTGHPLLGWHIRSFLKDTLFENHLSSEKPAFLVDHQIYESVVVPGTAFMETALAAATTAFTGDTHRLENVTIKEPLILPEEGEKTIQVVITPEGIEQATFQLVSLTGENDWHVHATGTINTVPAEKTPLLEKESLETVKARFQKEVDADMFYARLRELGLDYGPHFQGATQLWRGEGETLGHIQLPALAAADAGKYHVHPALLDACLHPGLLYCTLPSLGKESPNGEEMDEEIYIPVGFERYVVYQRAASAVWSHVTARSPEAGKRDIFTADMRLYSETGELVAEVVGLYLQRAPREALRRAMQANFNDWLYETAWEPRVRGEAATTDTETAGDWLIFTDESGVGAALTTQLQAQGAQCVFVQPGAAFSNIAAGQWQVDPANPDDFARLLREALPAQSEGWRGLVHLWGIDTPALEETDILSLEAMQQVNCGSILHLVQALAQGNASESPRLWLVTCGSQPVDNSESRLAPEQAPVWGMGHTIALEYPNLHCVRVDLEPGVAVDNAHMLFTEIWSPDSEDRIAFRGGSRYVARLARSVEKTGHKMKVPDQPYMLDITERGILDNLIFKPTPRRTPGPGEVEIRVRATGLNFRDVLKGLGMYPGPLGPFGDECAGDVVAVGEGVTHLQVGDAVFGMASGSFSRYVTTTADFVVRKPKNISYAEAATIPVTFLTAYYALHHVGQMKAGERILIHAAAGGVGMAATQLAHRAGVEVYGTASKRKWDVLRSMGIQHIMNSRTLDFSEEILEKTNGAGVHLVLNSLNGDFIPKSLAAMTDNGRFMEIGKVGIWSAEQVAEMKPDALYDIVFLDDVRVEQPALTREMLLELVAGIEDGSLKPLRHHLFPIEEVSEAFRFMAHAKHIGKIVITQPADANEQQTLLHPNASYLVTGGLGGLGLTVAKWMAAQGAEHLVLVGRSAPSPKAQEVISELEEAGVHITIASGDISQEADVSRILDDVNGTMPPLRGIIHAAGVLDDGIISEQNWSRFTRVMAPKIDGSWYLHTLTRNIPLDFFVLFSSITSVLGSAGQANYVAANSFMDTLAAQRRIQGRPALSVSWGPWAEVGMAATLERRRWTKQGMEPIVPEQGVQVLDQALRRATTHLTVLPIDWAVFLRSSNQPPLLAEIARETQAKSKVKSTAATEPMLLQKLAEASPDQHRHIVIDHIRDQARMVFGLSPDYPIDQRQSFNELGLDSLMAVELRNALNNSVKSSLPATLLFDYPTMETLADYLIQDVLSLGVADSVADEGPTAAEEQQAMDIAELEELSDDEAEALLLDELLNLKEGNA